MLQPHIKSSSKQGQIGQKYVLLSESTEYLDHMQQYHPKKDKLKHLTTQSIDQRQLFLLLVQSIYLIFAARCSHMSIFVSKNIFARKNISQIYGINKLYILKEHYQMLQEYSKKQIYQSYQYFQWNSSELHFQRMVLKSIQEFVGKIMLYSQRYPQYLANVYKFSFEEFVFVVNNFLSPKLGNIRQSRKLIECLEKTELFKGNSLFLVAKANIIYDQIKVYLQEREKFREILQYQNIIKNQLASMTSRTTQKLDYKTAIKRYIDKLMSVLADLQILYTFVSNDKSKQQQKKQQTLEPKLAQNSSIKKQQSSHVIWQFFTKQFTFKLTPDNINEYLNCPDSDAFQRNNKVSIPNRINHFIIEFYQPSQFIKIKILVDLNTNNNNADNIVYQINSTTTNHYNFPKIELHESKNSQPITKKIALSISLNLHQSKSITTRMLTILDTLILSQKILLSQLNKSSYSHNPSTQNISRIRFHFLNNIQTSYQAHLILQPQQSL